MTVDIDVRPRRAEDLPDLTEALLEQQPQTRYPVRDPLPFPVRDFLHFDDAVDAWTATVDGAPIGHISTTRRHTGVNGGDELDRACTARFLPRIHGAASFKAVIREEGAYPGAESRRIRIKPAKRRPRRRRGTNPRRDRSARPQ